MKLFFLLKGLVILPHKSVNHKNMAHEKTVQKEVKKASTKSLKEKRAEKKAKKESKKNN